jgi:hypothetical protein
LIVSIKATISLSVVNYSEQTNFGSASGMT